jgi:hypothetical protein
VGMARAGAIITRVTKNDVENLTMMVNQCALRREGR